MAIPGMTGEDQKPLLKYNAKTAKWHVDDKVVDKATMLVDFENGKSGWVKFAEGVAPDFRIVSMASLVAGCQYPPMPSDVDSKGKPMFRRGFQLMCKISDQLAAGKPQIREWASGSLATVRAVDQLHTQWLASRQNGKVCVVTVDGYKESPGQYGSNYQPILRIVKWIDRPADLKPDAVQATVQPAAATTPPPHVTDPIGEPEQFGEEEGEESPW
jgi:hypothetical protein